MENEVLFKVTDVSIEAGNIKGCAIVSIDEKQRKSKWAEIVGMFPENTKRVRKIPSMVRRSSITISNPFYSKLLVRFPNIPIKEVNGINIALATNFEYHDTLMADNEFGYSRWECCKNSWTPILFDKVIQAENDNALEQAFDSDIDTIDGLRNDIGKDNRGDIDFIDTWSWGSEEKKLFFPSRVELSEQELSDILDPYYVWIGNNVVCTHKKRFTLDNIKYSNFKVNGDSQTGNELDISNSVETSGVIYSGRMFTIQGGDKTTYKILSDCNYIGGHATISFTPSLTFSPNDQNKIQFEDEGDDQTSLDILNPNLIVEPRRNKRARNHMIKDCELYINFPPVEFDSEGNPIPL